jgi:hypothetical protein
MYTKLIAMQAHLIRRALVMGQVSNLQANEWLICTPTMLYVVNTPPLQAYVQR